MERIKNYIHKVPKKYLIVAATILLTVITAITVLTNQNNRQLHDDAVRSAPQNPQMGDAPQQTPSPQTAEDLAVLVPGNTENTETQFIVPTPVPPVKKDPVTFTFVDGVVTPENYYNSIYSLSFKDTWVWVSPAFEATGYTSWKFNYRCSLINETDKSYCRTTVQGSSDGTNWVHEKEALTYPAGEYIYDIEYKYYRVLVLSGACPTGCPQRPDFAQPYNFKATGYFY